MQLLHATVYISSLWIEFIQMNVIKLFWWVLDLFYSAIIPEFVYLCCINPSRHLPSTQSTVKVAETEMIIRFSCRWIKQFKLMSVLFSHLMLVVYTQADGV